MSDLDMPDSGAALPEEAFSEDLVEEALEEDIDLDVDDEDPDNDPIESTPRLLYPHLREISSLASWTVSSHKPGCGISALRHASTESFWQSDGPQPHTLTLHFAKRVKIAHMRLHVNHEQDESYTPTKIQIWAGTGYHDLLQVTEINLEAPKGWLAVDLSNAGGPSEFAADEDPYENAPTHGEELGNSDDDDAIMAQHMAQGVSVPHEIALRRQRRRRLRVGRGPTLRCFLVQVRILENHQNGKDTHLRGFQVFAKDHEVVGKRAQGVLEDRTNSNGRNPTTKPRKNKTQDREDAAMEKLARGLSNPSWMEVPELR